MRILIESFNFDVDLISIFQFVLCENCFVFIMDILYF